MINLGFGKRKRFPIRRVLALWLQNTVGVAIFAIILLTAALVVPVLHDIGASAPAAFVGDGGLNHALILPHHLLATTTDRGLINPSLSLKG